MDRAETGRRGEHAAAQVDLVPGAGPALGLVPERRDPPTRLLELARDTGCLFSIDSDAHAPGQLDMLDYGCERAEAAGIDPDRIVNTWELDRLLAWADPSGR